MLKLSVCDESKEVIVEQEIVGSLSQKTEVVCRFHVLLGPEPEHMAKIGSSWSDIERFMNTQMNRLHKMVPLTR